jgi:uncharacterized protein YoxC
MATTIQIDGDQITLNDAASEETLKELVEELKRQGSAGGSGVGGASKLKETEKSMNTAAKNLKNASVDLGKVVETFDDIEQTSSKTFTEIGNKIGKELGKIAKSTGSVITQLVRGPMSFETLGRAAQSGLSQAGELAEELTQGMAGAVPVIGSLGTVVKGATAVAGAGLMAVAAYAQNVTDGFVALSQQGANYHSDVVKISADIRGLGLNLNSFTQLVQQNAKGFAVFGGTVRAGTKHFVELADITKNQFGGNLYAMGIMFEEQAELLADYMVSQQRNTDFNNASYATQSQMYREYISDLGKIVTLTGKNRKQLASEIAQMELRADAELALSYATQDAKEAMALMRSYFDPGSAVDNIMMAGFAGRSLAAEIAAGTPGVKEFMAANPEAAEQIRLWSEQVANGQITQEQFFSNMHGLSGQVIHRSKEFQGLYGINDVATQALLATGGFKKINEQGNQIIKAQTTAVEDQEATWQGIKEGIEATGIGGTFVEIKGKLDKLSGEIAQGLQNTAADLAKQYGFSEDVGKDLDNFFTHVNEIQEAVADLTDPASKLGGTIKEFRESASGIKQSLASMLTTFQNFYTSFSIVAAAPWDFLMGGTSTSELKDQIKSKHGSKIGDNAWIDSLSGEDARAVLMGFGRSDEDGFATIEKIKKIKKSGAASTLNIDGASGGSTPVEANLAAGQAGQVVSLNNGVQVPIDDVINLENLADLQRLKAYLHNADTGGSAYAGHSFAKQIMKHQWRAMLEYAANGGDINDPMNIIREAVGGPYPDSILDNPDHPNYRKALYRSNWNNQYMGRPQGIPAFQYGGALGFGQSAYVGERGTELFTPSTAGTITPSNELATQSGNMSILTALDRINSGVQRLSESHMKVGDMSITALHDQLVALQKIVSINQKTGFGIRELRDANYS